MKKFLITSWVLLLIGTLCVWGAYNPPTIEFASKTSTSITFTISNPNFAITDSVVLICTVGPNDSAGAPTEAVLDSTALVITGTVTGLSPFVEYHAIIRVDSTGSDAKTYSPRDTTTTYQVVKERVFDVSLPFSRPLWRYNSWPIAETYNDSLFMSTTDSDSTLFFDIKKYIGIHFYSVGTTIDYTATAYGGECRDNSYFMVTSVDTTAITSAITEWTVDFPVSCTHGYIKLTGGATNDSTTVELTLRTDN